MRIALIVLTILYLAVGAPVSVQVGTKVIHSTPASFASFNFDWWPRNDQPWQNAGILNIDLKNPNLLYLASQLAPARLRVGGTLGDTIIYELGNHAVCRPGISCFNTSRWDEVNAFVKATNLDLVFGLNEMYNGRRAGDKWNTTNVESFLAYTAEKGYPIYGFEIGNELNGKLHPEDSAADAGLLKALLNKYWPNAQSRPLVIGPDDNQQPSWWDTYVRLSAPYVDIYTYHMYNGYGGDSKLSEKMLTTEFLDESTHAADSVVSIIKKYAPKSQVWLGEGAAAYDSGQDGTTNTFESSFYYLNALSTQAQHGHTGSQRQALVGGYYELIDKKTFAPNPDYYINLMWKKVMGVHVLSTKYDLSNKIRIYAQCTPGGTSGSVTMAVINVGNDTYTIDAQGIANVSPRHEYLLSSHGGNTRTRTVNLNGSPLLYSQGRLPTITPKVVSGQPISVPPLTVGFIVFPGANVQDCALVE